MMFGSSSKFREQTESKMWKRSQLFHATDFQSLMHPCFVFCRILGIFPYKINASTIETTKLRYILLVTFFCVFCIYELITLHKIIITKTVAYSDLTQTLEATCYYTFGGFIAFTTFVLSGPRMRVLQAMLKISSRLPPESYHKLSRWIHVKDILGSFFLFIQGWIYYFKVKHEHLACHVLGIYIALLVFNMDMQYMNYVCILKACFKRINNNLMHLQNILINGEYTPKLICDTQKNQFLIIELKALKKQHLRINNTIQMLNVSFSLQLLATITLSFTETTFEMYSHVLRWQDGLSIILDEIRDVFFLTSILFVISKLILVVWACETSKNQAFQIRTTVHDILNCTSDEQIKDELHLFSLQILHCARSTFSTKGVPVDATLLAAMTGSITTYILILAQFMVMSHSCDRKTASNITETYLEDSI